MTTRAEEQSEQRRWTARLRRPTNIYDALLENEFAPPDIRQAAVKRALKQILEFAARRVPYYRGLDESVLGDPLHALSTLPILTKPGVHDAGPALLAQSLPDGEGVGAWTESSGTTARPTRVLFSARSAAMFTILKQREYRWFRLDPSGVFASMRLPAQLPRRAGGKRAAVGETVRVPAWPYPSNFSTGPFIGISIFTPVEDRIAWLRHERPDYLMAFGQSLEILGLNAGETRPADSIKGVISISDEMTPGMRAFVESRFKAPVHQNYGLNEIGLVGIRCAGGRYHIHTEHCWVEIVDEEGRACAPGETGRILVTSLNNFAMPLIRYDTGDLAQAVEGDCPCGRMLPAIGDIVGRYGRVAFVPPGSMVRVVALREAIETMPAELSRHLREFQVHQYGDHRMELRLVTRNVLPPAFEAYIRSAWAKVAKDDNPPLSIVRVDAIARSPGGKAEVFTSDFMPKRDDPVPHATPGIPPP